MKLRTVSIMLLCIVFACAATISAGAARSVQSAQRATVWIQRGMDTWTVEGFTAGRELLIRLDTFLLMGADSHFSLRTGEITLRAPNWRASATLGSRQARIDGRNILLAVPPQTAVPDRNGPEAVFVPVTRIARSLGYRVVYQERVGEIRRVFTLTSPDYHLPVQDFHKQRLVPPSTQRSGNLTATATLRVDSSTATDEPNGNPFDVGVTIHNEGTELYHASREFIYLELWDGTVMSSSSERLGVGHPGASIEPGDDGLVDARWIFARSDIRPVKRVIYFDSQHRFDWRVEQYTK